MTLNDIDVSKLDFSVIKEDLKTINKQLDKIHKNKKLMKIYNEYVKEKEKSK